MSDAQPAAPAPTASGDVKMDDAAAAAASGDAAAADANGAAPMDTAAPKKKKVKKSDVPFQVSNFS